MKIAVLGARGFVGSSLAHYLNPFHTVTPVTRDTVDLVDPIQVREWLWKSKFDVVINAATTMGNNNLLDDTRNNLGLFMNFYNHSDLFGKFINLSSGAEFDRTQNINEVPEQKIFDVMPTDSYDFGQNMKSRISYNTPGFYTIRIFNCFGLGEIPTRIFPRYLKKGNETFEVFNDRYFDYFSVRDLCAVVQHCTENTWTEKDINAVYKKKYKISEVLDMFCRLNNLPADFAIVSTSENNYTGSGRRLSNIPVQLEGLEQGLIKYNEPL